MDIESEDRNERDSEMREELRPFFLRLQRLDIYVHLRNCKTLRYIHNPTHTHTHNTPPPRNPWTLGCFDKLNKLHAWMHINIARYSCSVIESVFYVPIWNRCKNHWMDIICKILCVLLAHKKFIACSLILSVAAPPSPPPDRDLYAATDA